MGTNCARLVADLFLYCYEREYMDSLNLSEPEFYGDLVYKFKKLIESNDFSFQSRNYTLQTYRL